MKEYKFTLNVPFEFTGLGDPYITIGVLATELPTGDIHLLFSKVSGYATKTLDWTKVNDVAEERARAFWQSRANAKAIGDARVDENGSLSIYPINEEL